MLCILMLDGNTSSSLTFSPFPCRPRAALLQKKANTLTIFDNPDTYQTYLDAYNTVFTVRFWEWDHPMPACLH